MGTFELGALLLVLRPPTLGKIEVLQAESFPAVAVELLRGSGVSGNLANHYNWGNYLVWRLRPKFIISIDTRREMA